MNPFIVSGYKDPEFFCDRSLETDRILSAIKNQRHLTLFSLRRMGKTGLIWHVFHKLKKSKKIVPVYLDIMPTLSFSEFTAALAKAILSKLAEKESFIKTILKQLSALRPALTYDAVTGSPEISIKVDRADNLNDSLDSVFKFLAQQKHHFVIAIDEFQQVAFYPEKSVEATLRSQIQNLKNATFIFSGSRRHILSEIFSSPNRPFFNSTEIMEIVSINAEEYKTFIQLHFGKARKSIDIKALDLINEYTSLHTFYVQFLCNRLYELNHKIISKDDVEKTYIQIINENEPIYGNYMNLLTRFQIQLLRAIANERGAAGILSKGFLEKYNMGAASSVNTAVKSLLDKDFIYKKDEKYHMVDKFFEGWLRQADFL